MSDPGDQIVKKPIPITTEEFDRKVEAGEDIDDHLDWENAVMLEPGEMSPGQKLAIAEELIAELLTGSTSGSRAREPEKLSVSISKVTILKIGSEAARRGVSREALVEAWIEERAFAQAATK